MGPQRAIGKYLDASHIYARSHKGGDTDVWEIFCRPLELPVDDASAEREKRWPSEIMNITPQ